MKQMLFTLFMALFLKNSIAQSGRVDPATGQYTFTGTLAGNYMFYGYAEPDTRSKKLIMFSVYPLSFSDQIFSQYPLGAYHETTNLKDGERIEYTGHKNGYAKMRFLNADHAETIFYLKQGYVKTP